MITGAEGYVGSRLVPVLLDGVSRVRCLASEPGSLTGKVPAGVELAGGDLTQPAALAAALEGVETAYYLAAPSLGLADAGGGAAARFGAAARGAGVRRIVTFGSFGAPVPGSGAPVDDDSGEALRAAGVPVIELHASVIIGPGSLCFEMIRSLVERLPVMPVPRWMRAPVRPIFIGDLLACLAAAGKLDTDGSRTFAVGGPDEVSHADLIREYARLRGLRRWLLPVPGDAPWLSSACLRVTTPLRARRGRTAAGRVRAAALAPSAPPPPELCVRPLGVREAMSRAIQVERAAITGTRWSQAVSVDDARRRWGGAPHWNWRVDSRVVTIAAPPVAAFCVVESIGGANGYYSAPLLWRLRGWMDRAVGGPGLGRGRRDPKRLEVGDVVDWWRVAALERDRRLLLAAELRLPGRGWLEFELQPADGGRHTSLRQTALFDPLGVAGLLYWYALWPFHWLVFAQMVRGLARQAERGS